MKELLILFVTMYVIGEIMNLIGYAIVTYCSTETVFGLRGAMTRNWLMTNLNYKNGKDYIKWAIIGAPLRLILSPISMIGMIGVMLETLFLNMKVIFD